MSARTHQHPRSNFIIDYPRILLLLDALYLHTLPHSRSASSQQVRVKLTASDTVADRLFIQNRNRLFLHCGDLKSGNRLEGAASGVLCGIDAEQFDDWRCNPAGAHLVAREICPIEYEDFESRVPQRPRAR